MTAYSISDMMTSDSWPVLGKQRPEKCVVFFVQVALIFVVVIASIVNLALKTGDDKLWIVLLSSSIGYLLPSPNFGKLQNTAQ